MPKKSIIDENGFDHRFSQSKRNFLKLTATVFLGTLYFSCSPYSGIKKISETTDDGRKTKVVIIGSGITGIALGALLVKAGYDVKVLESHPKLVGGHARIITTNDIEFSAGPQYVWSFGPDQIGERMLKHLDIDKDVPFEHMDKSAFENIFIGDHSKIEIPMGFKNFKNSLYEIFPNEQDNLDKFFDYVINLFEVMKFIHDEGLYMMDFSAMKASVVFTSELTNKAKEYAYWFGNWTLKQMFDHCNLSLDARKILFGHAGVFAENADEISFGIYVAATGFLHDGAFYPKYGFESLISGLTSAIEKNNGKVLTGKKVNKLIVGGSSNGSQKSGGKTHRLVKEVVCEDGSTFESDVVFSTLAPRLTYQLIENSDLNIFNYEPSNSFSCAYIGLHNYSKFVNKLKGKNYWWISDKETIDFNSPDMMEPPSYLFIGSNSANTIPMHETSKNSSLTVFAPGNYDQSRAIYEKGKSSYEEFKSNLNENIIDLLEKYFFPNLNKHILFMDLYTPWDIHQETGAEKGNVYGRRLTPQSILSAVRKIRGIDNLHIGCATTGVPGVSVGFQTASIIFTKLTGETI